MPDYVAQYVEQQTGSTRYYGRFAARVITQAADGTVDVVCDDERVGGVGRAPIRLGLPGTEVEVLPGARCTVAFEDGSPQKPVVVAFEQAADVAKIRIKALVVEIDADTVVRIQGGVQPVARVGDMAGPYPIAPPGNVRVLA